MKYLISGVAPGFGGVGKLMEYLYDTIDKTEYTLIYPKVFTFKNKYLRGLFNRISKDIVFNIKVFFIKNKNVVLIHHQSLGLRNTKKLIKNNKVDFYIMDNAFFCLKSYNYIDDSNKECLECINSDFDTVIKNKCNPFPIKYKINENINFLRFLKEESKNINFYTLSHSNAELLKKHFGDVKVKAIYFLTNDILDDQFESNNSISEYDKGFDIVYHGADIDAKGFKYVQELSKVLPQFRFLIPTNKFIEDKLSNLVCKGMTWETGLKNEVINAKLVLTPSLWSNTPEAATLKSFLFNGSVGMIKNKYGFANDVDNDSVLSLTGNISEDAMIINDFLLAKEYKELSLKGKKYMVKYIEMSKKLMKELF